MPPGGPGKWFVLGEGHRAQRMRAGGAGSSWGLAEPRGLGLGAAPCVSPPFQGGRTSRSARHCGRPCGHNCMLLCHDARPAQVGSGVFTRGTRSRTGPSPASDHGGGEQSPRHTLDRTLPTGCPHAPWMAPPLKPPRGVPEWPFGVLADLEDVGGDSRAPPWKPQQGRLAWPVLMARLCVGGPRHRVQAGRKEANVAGSRRALLASASGVPLFPGALPGQRWTRNARRGHLPGGEAGGLGSWRRVQSFPRLCRFLSVHLLQD